MRRNFQIGDKVIHLNYGEGTVVEDVSNQYAEAYKVEYVTKRVLTSSASLLLKV